MTLLASVNRLRQLQRDEGISATSMAQLDHQTAIGLLNDAANEVLNTHQWSFLRRYDGYAFFPALFEATTGLLAQDGSTFILLNAAAVNAWNAASAAAFSTRVRARLRITNSAEFPNTTFILSDVDTAAHFPATLSTEYHGANINSTGAYEIYANEFVLPATVRRVLDVIEQEGDVRISFVDRDLDGMAYWQTGHYGDSTYEVAVGGFGSSTTLASAAATTGELLTIWPPPSSDLYLQYSYLYRYPALSADTDAWTGVPSEVEMLIQNIAFEKSLDSNVEDESDRGVRWHGKNQAMMTRLLAQDDRAPNRRLIPREIGMGGRSRDPYARWSSRSVPSP